MKIFIVGLGIIGASYAEGLNRKGHQIYAYNRSDRPITEGSIFHVITYGLNSMGSHANQLDAKERWLVANYVLKLKSEL